MPAMNRLIDRMHEYTAPLRALLESDPNRRPAVGRALRVILTLVMPATAILASPLPGRAAPAQTSPGAPDWLAELGLRPGTRPAAAPNPRLQQLAAAYARLPLSFEANEGQSDPQVRFLARGPGYTLFLTDAATAVLAGGKDHQPQVVRLELAGANPHPASEALEAQAARSAYFIGNDPARWRTAIARYGRVRF
jgi:hypothetical protein